jgi:hypothetical protein
MSDIPDAVIELSARVAAKAEDASNWDDEADYYRSGWCNRVEPAITAAAPHLIAAAIRTIAADTRARGDVGKEEQGGIEAWVYLEWKAQQLLEQAQ